MCAMIEKLRMCCMGSKRKGHREVPLLCYASARLWRRNTLNFSRFMPLKRVRPGGSRENRIERAGVQLVMTYFMTFGEQHRDQRAPTRFERGVGVDVDFEHGNVGDMLGQRRPHVITQVTIGADEQRQPDGHRRRSSRFGSAPPA